MKLVIVINGKGGVGKDYLINIVKKKYGITNVSSITPIKEIAKKNGWDGIKDEKGRKLLHDLKKVFGDYCDLSNEYLLSEYHKFLQDDSKSIMFVHIREAAEIEKFLKYVEVPKTTLLVRGDVFEEIFGNDSDDKVEEYEYEFEYFNNKSSGGTEEEFTKFLDDVVKCKTVSQDNEAKTSEGGSDFVPRKISEFFAPEVVVEKLCMYLINDIRYGAIDSCLYRLNSYKEARHISDKEAVASISLSKNTHWLDLQPSIVDTKKIYFVVYSDGSKKYNGYFEKDMVVAFDKIFNFGRIRETSINNVEVQGYFSLMKYSGDDKYYVGDVKIHVYDKD